MMQWKLYYMKWDLMSLKGKVQNTPNHSIGVNGTEVDWSAHNASWVPTFALLQTRESPRFESEEEDLDLLEEASTSSRRRHGGSSLLLGVPPRTKKVAKLMTTQQAALDKVQSQLADFERDMNTLVNWMAHHDMALEQEEAVVSEGRSQSGRRRRTTVAETGLHQPEEARKLLMEQIGAAWNQTADLWDKFKAMGEQLQDVKERASSDDSLAQISAEEVAERPRSKVSGHDITQEVADELTGFVNTVGHALGGW